MVILLSGNCPLWSIQVREVFQVCPAHPFLWFRARDGDLFSLFIRSKMFPVKTKLPEAGGKQGLILAFGKQKTLGSNLLSQEPPSELLAFRRVGMARKARPPSSAAPQPEIDIRVG
jgi:hypothetical protein